MCIDKVHKFKHVKHKSESLPAYLKCCPWPVCIVRGCRATEQESNIKRRACQRAPLQKKYAGYAVSSAACAVLLLAAFAYVFTQFYEQITTGSSSI